MGLFSALSRLLFGGSSKESPPTTRLKDVASQVEIELTPRTPHRITVRPMITTGPHAESTFESCCTAISEDDPREFKWNLSLLLEISEDQYVECEALVSHLSNRSELSDEWLPVLNWWCGQEVDDSIRREVQRLAARSTRRLLMRIGNLSLMDRMKIQDAAKRVRDRLQTGPLKTYQEMNSVPASNGVYGVYFESDPRFGDLSKCHSHGIWRLLYVGKAETQTLRQRLTQHFDGKDATASGALRETMGAILVDELRLTLDPEKLKRDVCDYGDAGEANVKAWLKERSQFAVAAVSDPDLRWPIELPHSVELIEDELIDQLCWLPLNRKQTRREISTVARDACARARAKARVK